jgi:ATP-dependent RNA helicase MRH4
MNSSTPIEVVAATAAEVADTAEKLDRVRCVTKTALLPLRQWLTSNSMTQTKSPQNDEKLDFEMELGDPEEELKTPLFAHESFGAYDFATADDGLDPDYEDEPMIRPDSSWSAPHDLYTTDEIDLHDPTLEKFPSDRGSIMDTLRRIQSSSSVDHSHFESFLQSPRFAPRRQSVDSNDEGSILTSGSLSPTSNRKRDSRLSHSSVGRTKSAVSLRSIAEEGSKQGHESSNALKIEQGWD